MLKGVERISMGAYELKNRDSILGRLPVQIRGCVEKSLDLATTKAGRFAPLILGFQPVRLISSPRSVVVP